MILRHALTKPLFTTFLILLLFNATITQAVDAEKDYSDELPRIAPLSPKDALNSFQIAEGFKIERVASEPLVVDPIAMAFDADGRMFVIEMRGYSEDADKNLGRVKLLTDSDHDGRFDKGSIFLDGLSWPTAVTCYDGGIFIAVAPDILYCKDIDGDGVADIRQRVFTGFGRGNVQGLVNTLKWGPDHRIHGATSSSGGIVKRVYDSNDKGINLRGRDFSFDPKLLDLRPESGGAQHGMSFDDWGRKFVCSNSDHLQAVMYEDRYAGRNPYLAAPRSRVSIATDGPQAAVYRISPVEPWRIVRTRLRVAKTVRGPVEGGGKPAGYFTGSTGVTIIRGDAFPEASRGHAIIGDVGSNIVHRKRITPKGVGFIGERIDVKKEFVASKDIWFRPAQFANGPDGGLYIADMYREVIEHPKSLPPMIKKHLDLTSGRDRGRIYRVTQTSFKQPIHTGLSNISTRQLVAQLESQNGERRSTADRLLYERQDRSAVKPLETMASTSASALTRMHAIRVLHGLKSLRAEILLPRLSDDHPPVREHAVRLSESLLLSDAIRAKLFSMTKDDDRRVRYQLAFTLGESKDTKRLIALSQLLTHSGNDSWIRFAVLSSLRSDAGTVLANIESDRVFAMSATGKTVRAELTKLIATAKRIGDKVGGPVVIKNQQKRTPEEKAAREKLIGRYRPSLATRGDSKGGLAVFTKNCAACHRVGNVGKAIGPNLVAMRSRGPEAILANVLDPNREVNPQYLSYHLTTNEDDHHTGMIVAESATGLSLLRGDGTTIKLLRADIETIRQSSLSFMPEGLEKSIDLKAMADLLAFLMKTP